MRAEYKRDMNHNYLILHGDKDIDTASYQVRMLVGNAVPSLLKCRVQSIDGKFMVYYDITSRQPVSTLYEQRKFGIEDLRMIFGGFIQVMEEMSEYLLNPGELVIRPEYIYMDIEKKELFFCYLPGFQQDVREQFQALTEYVLPKLDHEDGKAVMLGYGVYRRALEDSFHLEHIKEDLYHIQDKTDAQSKAPLRDKAAGEKDAKHPEMMDRIFRHEGTGHSAEGWENSGMISGTDGAEKPFNDNGEEENGFFRREDGNIKKNKGKKAGNKYTAKREKGLSESDGGLKSRLWKHIIWSGAGAIILMGIISAKLLGYLPGMSIESILGVVLVCMGVGMLIYKIYAARRQDKDTEKTGATRRGDAEKRGATGKRKDLGKISDTEKPAFSQSDWTQNYSGVSDYKKEEIDKGYLYRRDFDFGADFEEQGPPPENCGETVILSENPVAGPATLVSREPGELATIFLKDELTVVGKLETAADAVINLPTVSRVHAKIKKKDGEYYLSDLNSRNGTSVNGRMLKSEEEYRLVDQDEVDFAQARYVFLE
ncbi:DUF6382 domain-containing protein [Blautia schinkii]|nr:DUF6382 domain-containing protein [Blautia schinkii]